MGYRQDVKLNNKVFVKANCKLNQTTMIQYTPPPPPQKKSDKLEGAFSIAQHQTCLNPSST